MIDKHTPVPADAVPVGYPPEDVDILLVDDNGASVPVGEPGELVIRSPHLALGYWNQPTSSDQRLSTHPDNETRREYRTGDIGRFLPDGRLIHIGRGDSRVKIRGQSVEMVEVEMALEAIANIREAVVVNRPDDAGQSRLVAYIVAGQQGVTVSEVRSELDTVLPSFMVPSEFVFMEALPLNANGKVDRRSLPSPDPLCSSDVETSSPRTNIEKKLCSIWMQVLEVPRVGIHDGFRDLGGHSLQAMSLIDAINQEFDCDLSPRALLESDTVHKFANILEQPDHPSDWSPLVRIKSQGSQPPLFMVHPLDGHVLDYLDLANCLSNDLPLYGLEAQGTNKHQQPHTSVHSMASLYIDAIRQIHPRGPYRLGGFSFGGLIAYEMACQLSDDGQKVEFLLIGDTWVVRGVHFNPVRYQLSRFTYPFGVKRREWVEVISRKLGIRTIAQPSRRRRSAPELHERMVRAHKQAISNYQARTYPGKITLLRAQEYFRKVRRLQRYFGGSSMGWNSLAIGGVDVHFLPGRHFELFGAVNASRIAQIIAQTL